MFGVNEHLCGGGTVPLGTNQSTQMEGRLLMEIQRLHVGRALGLRRADYGNY